MRVLIVAVTVMAVFFGYLLVSAVQSVKEGEVAAIHQFMVGVGR